MLYIFSKLESLKSDRRGVTALEYAVVGAVVVGAVATAFASFGTALSDKLAGLLSTAT
ncbi:MAG: hypothetical protein J0H91_18895 [Rhodospirillales bacterium]|nr:hypothetical protein [Rhodospirillales bacterium]